MTTNITADDGDAMERVLRRDHRACRCDHPRRRQRDLIATRIR
jgi:hypothetical protein